MFYAVIVVLLTWAVLMPLRFRWQEKKALGLTFKAIPTILAAGVAGYAVFFVPGADGYARFIFAGLCVCVAADVLLGIRLEIGGALFFAGHVLYVAGLSIYRPLSWWCLTVFLFSTVIMEWVLHRHRQEAPTGLLLAGVRIYVVALSALLGFSLPLPFLAYSSRAVLAALGGVLFVISDLTLCYNSLRKKPVSWHYVSLGIYYTAQLLLGYSALHLS